MKKQRAEELVGKMSQLVEPAEDWHEVGAENEPPFENSWSNFGSGWDTAAFYKTIDRVYIKGLVAGGTLNTTVFTLPEGYRPSASQMLIGEENLYTHVRIKIGTDGTVTTNGGASNTYLSLWVSFRI